MRYYWEIRVNGIREGGPLYVTWETAAAAFFSRARRALSEELRLPRAGSNPWESAREMEGKVEALARQILSEKARPRPNLTFSHGRYHFALSRVARET